MINSSAQMVPLYLSAEFAFRQTSHYYMCFFTSLQKHGKNFFRKLRLPAKSFYGRLNNENFKKCDFYFYVGSFGFMYKKRKQDDCK